jgi:nucleoside-diphosphate-sugar epimerase
MYAQLSDVEYYGLRFGTVNGYSPIFRNDIMINAMVFNALKDGNINLYIKDIQRPILGIKDLVNAICAIIDTGSYEKRGLYNLCSFNSTPEKIAYKISEKLQINVKELEISDISKITNVKLQAKSYNFAINCNKFITNFNFKFNETIDTIVEEIVDNFDTMKKDNRTNNKKYGK